MIWRAEFLLNLFSLSYHLCLMAQPLSLSLSAHMRGFRFTVDNCNSINRKGESDSTCSENSSSMELLECEQKNIILNRREEFLLATTSADENEFFFSKLFPTDLHLELSEFGFRIFSYLKYHFRSDHQTSSEHIGNNSIEIQNVHIFRTFEVPLFHTKYIWNFGRLSYCFSTISQ